MMTKLIENIVIVGADLHAWTMALGLISELPAKSVSITVVGHPDVQGAAGRHFAEDCSGVLSLDAPAHEFHQRVGLKEASLIAALNGSYRYGTQLYSGNHHDRSDTEPVFCYTPTGEMLNNVEFHHYLSKLRLEGNQADFARYSLAALAAAQKRFTHPAADSMLAKLEYNLQFDRRGYTSFVKNTALDRGVKYIEHDVIAAEQTGSGVISKLELNSGDLLATDFVFDCSGVIFDEVLGITNDSFADTLPYNRYLSWMTTCSQATSPLNGFKGFAQSCLLSQPIPAGKAYTLSYRDKQLSDQQALERAKKFSPSQSLGQLSYGSLNARVRSEHWVLNAVAIGTVAGSAGNFIFGSLFHTHTALARWLELYPRHDINPYLSKQYNKATNTEYRRVLDVHGLLLSTFDSEIVQPETLEHRVRLFAATGNAAFYEQDVFDKHQWINLLMACGVWPQRCDVMLAQQSEQVIKQSLAMVENNNQTLVASMPSLDALLNAISQAV